MTGRTHTSRHTAKRRRRHSPWWAELSEEELLDQRICDLDLKIDGTLLAERVARLYHEMAARGLTFQPHVWLSSEWFSPDGVPGVAIPFFLAHRRLATIERRNMLEVEGGNENWCMRILRHEAGHAIDSAYRLHRRQRWRRLFGPFSQPYPDYYQPRPYSRSFVLHLDMWYAQAHPAEDFAETFAVWLAPQSRWRQRYHGWGALRKLEYVDELMRSLRGVRPAVTSRAMPERVSTLRQTLREYYRQKRRQYMEDWPEFYDRDLRRLFSDEPRHRKHPSAAAFLRRVRPELRRLVAKWTGEYQYTIDQVLRDMIDRCRELNLRLVRPGRQVRIEALVMVTVQTMNYLHAGHHSVAL